MKRSKCEFDAPSVVYLGHVVSAEGVAMNHQKVQVVVNWPVPRSIRAVCAFLDLAGYYRRFIAGYDDIATPLMRLLKKDGFAWTAKAEAAFRTLQRALMMAPVLQLPDFDRVFIVECDASGHDLDVVLHQGVGPMAFFSRQMAPRHYKLAAYECELIALVQAVKHWRPYLWGRAFMIRTYHYSLKFLLDQHLAIIPQHQWASKLIGFDFKVEFKPGMTNIITDAPSRRDTEETAEVMTLSIPSFSLFDDLRREMDADEALCALRIEIVAGGRDATWSVVDGRVYVPATSPSLWDMKERRRHYTACRRISMYRGRAPWCGTSSAPVPSANATRASICTRRDSCSH
jgi:hypothetical protein